MSTFQVEFKLVEIGCIDIDAESEEDAIEKFNDMKVDRGEELSIITQDREFFLQSVDEVSGV